MGAKHSKKTGQIINNLMSVEELVQELFEAPVEGQTRAELNLRKDINPKLKIVDASVGGQTAKENFYETAIPTARFLDVAGQLKDKNGKFPNTFPPENVVKNLMGNIGVQRKDKIVLYTQPGKTIGATRAYFVLESYGFKHLSVLDGGLKRYIDEGYPTEAGKDYTGKTVNINKLDNPDENVVKVCEIAGFALGKLDDLQLVDCRPENSFKGEATDNIEGCRQGHIPGSVNIPASLFTNPETGTFKSKEELQEIIRNHNLDPEKRTATM